MTRQQQHPRALLKLATLTFLLVACGSPGSDASSGSGWTGMAPSLESCELFPADHIWNVPVDGLPVHAQSAVYVDTIGASAGVHPDFGAGLWDGGIIGIPYDTVGASQPDAEVSFYYDDESDPGPYPIPDDAAVEGAPPGGFADGGDRHVIVVDSDTCVLYELFDAEQQTDGTWSAGSGAVYDLGGYELRPDGWTSADAAGLPILPGLVRYDEVAAGEIAHALRFTAPQTRDEHVWPARHDASNRTGAEYPPLGQRFRLRADYDAAGLSQEAQVVIEALKRYGMILADNGSAWFLSGVPDDRWDNDALRDLRQLTGADFEAVDVTPLMVDPDSGRTR